MNRWLFRLIDVLAWAAIVIFGAVVLGMLAWGIWQLLPASLFFVGFLVWLIAAFWWLDVGRKPYR